MQESKWASAVSQLLNLWITNYQTPKSYIDISQAKGAGGCVGCLLILGMMDAINRFRWQWEVGSVVVSQAVMQSGAVIWTHSVMRFLGRVRSGCSTFSGMLCWEELSWVRIDHYTSQDRHPSHEMATSLMYSNSRYVYCFMLVWVGMS